MCNQSPTKILIAEDEGIIGLSLRMELESSGHEVCGVVATGEDAVACAFRSRPDLVLMDINLSGEMDGIEAAQKIRTLRKVRLIFMTGYVDRDLMDRALSLKPLAYVTKPVSIYDLQLIIDTWRNSPTAPPAILH
ncbi:MAG: response regulator [Kiritimatiellia bacterium]